MISPLKASRSRISGFDIRSWLAFAALSACRTQVPPGFGLKYFSYLSVTSLNSSASGGYCFFRVIFGQLAEYWRFGVATRSARGPLARQSGLAGPLGAPTYAIMPSL